MALPLMGIVGALGGKLLAAGALAALARKALMTTLVVTVLPIVLYNLFIKITKELMQVAMNHASANGVQSVVWQMTGMGAWIASEINLPAVFTVIMSAVALKFTLRMISPRF